MTQTPPTSTSLDTLFTRRVFNLVALGALGALALPGCASLLGTKPEPTPLRILSGGAAKGIVERLAPAFEHARNCRIEATFGAVGAMRDQLLAGAPCDVLVLTQAALTDLAASGWTAGTSAAAPLGQVKTGVCLMKGRPSVALQTVDDLRRLLASASAIYFSDPKKSTAGIHFMKVLNALGFTDSSQYRTYPDGSTAMAAMAAAGDPRAVGCTQITEIITVPGVELIGFLPAPYELSTPYAAAVTVQTQKAELARAFVAHISASQFSDEREKAGFL